MAQVKVDKRFLWLTEMASMLADDSIDNPTETWLYWLFKNEVHYAKDD